MLSAVLRIKLERLGAAELERDGEDDDDEEGMWDRQYAMTQSMKFLKMKKSKDPKMVPADIVGVATEGVKK